VDVEPPSSWLVGSAYIDLMNATIDRLKAFCIKAYRGVAHDRHKPGKMPDVGIELYHPLTGQLLNSTEAQEK
jgi:hypothetical protein